MKVISFPLLAIVFLLLGCSGERNETIPAQVINPSPDFRPNILWLVAEDMSPTIPPYGDSTIVTPVLDQLAGEGVVYDNFFTPHPVCAPARAAIITGMYANHIGASHMRTGPWYSDDIPQATIAAYAQYMPPGLQAYEAIPMEGVKMFSELLREAGYYCTNNNKQDYQFRKTMTAWDDNSRKATWRNRKKGQPFFSVINFEVTHESRIWAKAEDSLWVARSLKVPVPPYLPDTEAAKVDVRRMYSNILEMDFQVGRVLKELESDGLLDSTIVIWYSDHGGPLPRQKRALYESGVKVPMIIRFPGGEFAGMRDDRMISFIDLAPTMLSLAGIQPPAYMDGTAFMGKYARTEEPAFVFGAADRFDEKYDRRRFVRNDRFKYIRNYMTDQPVYLDLSYRKQMSIMQELLRLREEGNLTPEQARWFDPVKEPEELYDLKNDPFELTNLAQDQSYAPVLEEMRTAMDTWLSGFEDTGLIQESDLIAKIWPDGAQPRTANPEIGVDRDGQIIIQCRTPGASVGYRISGGTEVNSAWEIYSKPFPSNPGTEIEAVAHRPGFLRSEIILFKKNVGN
ncbi:sulfatase-like hydrolase/transferase [Fulvivirga sedimenti]|uniref:Sulfatase-like hydrolase/transferase n=1 Tax=Fulvivirga sedimenti TaxID=2879465 RepID=A0A9X1KVI9_9BACT|nr:sulfatase-like hydrolase/transferase [Fulvivirga sedimenti]MCA6073745.1 sulfatase-like hydrolase/transferase [Fulvivirga sedimenti]